MLTIWTSNRGSPSINDVPKALALCCGFLRRATVVWRRLTLATSFLRVKTRLDRLGGTLKDIYVPDSVVENIQRSLANEKASRKDLGFARKNCGYSRALH